MALKIINVQDHVYRLRCAFPYTITPVPGVFSVVNPADVLAPGECVEFKTTADIVVEISNDEIHVKVG